MSVVKRQLRDEKSQGVAKMMNERANVALGNNYHDGFDDPDDGGLSIIRGTKLKFTNAAKWLTGDGDEINPAREFLVVELVRVVQKWKDGKPVGPETRIMAPGEPFPDIDELNEAAPKEEWRDHYGKAVGPYEKSCVAYLLDPVTMACFTFPTTTVGGFKAFKTLKDETKRARLVQGANVFPIVTLGDANMPTQFEPAGRRRPAFIVKRNVPIGPAPEPKPVIAAPTLEEPPQPTPKKGDSDGERDDHIPW
jgi:hypothetical protein